MQNVKASFKNLGMKARKFVVPATMIGSSVTAFGMNNVHAQSVNFTAINAIIESVTTVIPSLIDLVNAVIPLIIDLVVVMLVIEVIMIVPEFISRFLNKI